MLGHVLGHEYEAWYSSLHLAADMAVPDVAQDVSSYSPVATATNSSTRQSSHPGMMQLSVDSCLPLHELQPVIYSTLSYSIGVERNQYSEAPLLVTNLLGHGDVVILQGQATGGCELPLHQPSSDQLKMPGKHAAARTEVATSSFESSLASLAAHLRAWTPPSTVERADHLGMYTSSMEGYSGTSTRLDQAVGIAPGSSHPSQDEPSQLSHVQYSSLGVSSSQRLAGAANELWDMHQAAYERELCTSALQTSDLQVAMLPRGCDSLVKPSTQGALNARHGAAAPPVPPERAEKTVFVAPLQSSITGEVLARAFAQCGTVVSAQVVYNSRSMWRPRHLWRSREFGFVEFVSSEAAACAVATFHRQWLPICKGQQLLFVKKTGLLGEAEPVMTTST